MSTAQEIYNLLTAPEGLKGKNGSIKFELNGLAVLIETRDTVGNLIQEWIKEFLTAKGIQFKIKANTQAFPDIQLDILNPKQGMLEVKSFDFDRGPGFDIANFDSYCNSLTTDAYRLNADYLIIAYKMKDGVITIADIWLKKIWEIAGSSSTYACKVQEKKNVIYNLRPIIWYSEKSTFKPFPSLEIFLSALNETRYRYPQTKHLNAHWLSKVKQNYAFHTGIELVVPKWEDVKLA